jgi:hypothetical protein
MKHPTLLKKAVSTYMPMLIRFIEVTDKPILECGSGLFSTPFLHWYCRERNLPLFTYEDNEEYFPFAKQFRSRNHHVRFIKDWNEIEKRHWGVVLIDQGEGKKGIDDRIKTAIALKDSADYIVMHDSQFKDMYKDVYPHFKYRYDWKDCKPWTTVVSNFHNLNEL